MYTKSIYIEDLIDLSNLLRFVQPSTQSRSTAKVWSEFEGTKMTMLMHLYKTTGANNIEDVLITWW
jgi:hypothetical protein